MYPARQRRAELQAARRYRWPRSPDLHAAHWRPSRRLWDAALLLDALPAAGGLIAACISSKSNRKTSFHMARRFTARA